MFEHHDHQAPSPVTRDESKLEVISSDGIDRRGFLKCMAWAGTGMVWSFVGGVPVSYALGRASHNATSASTNLRTPT